MLRLEIAGWGMAAGIPTLIMASASLDDVLAITGFGVAQAIAFSDGKIVQVAFKGPTGVAAGAISGMLLAIIICILPPPGMVRKILITLISELLVPWSICTTDKSETTRSMPIGANLVMWVTKYI